MNVSLHFVREKKKQKYNAWTGAYRSDHISVYAYLLPSNKIKLSFIHQFASSYFRTLGIQHDGANLLTLRNGSSQVSNYLRVILQYNIINAYSTRYWVAYFVCAMRKIQPAHIHACIDQTAQHFLAHSLWPNSAYYFCFKK